jgi:hypothetical protein
MDGSTDVTEGNVLKCGTDGKITEKIDTHAAKRQST